MKTTTSKTTKRGQAMAKWARGFYTAADLRMWADEQGRKSDEAAARGCADDAAMYAAAYMAASL